MQQSRTTLASRDLVLQVVCQNRLRLWLLRVVLFQLNRQRAFPGIRTNDKLGREFPRVRSANGISTRIKIGARITKPPIHTAWHAGPTALWKAKECGGGSTARSESPFRLCGGWLVRFWVDSRCSTRWRNVVATSSKVPTKLPIDRCSAFQIGLVASSQLPQNICLLKGFCLQLGRSW